MGAMTIEIGKFYRTRAGLKVGPMKEGFMGLIGECDGCNWGYSRDGKFGQLSGRHPDHDRFDWQRERDLIAEWTDAPTGPVRTVTRKEIVPGTYAGGVTVVPSTDMSGEGRVSIATALGRATAAELRAAIATLTEIADALEAPTQ